MFFLQFILVLINKLLIFHYCYLLIFSFIISISFIISQFTPMYLYIQVDHIRIYHRAACVIRGSRLIAPVGGVHHLWVTFYCSNTWRASPMGHTRLSQKMTYISSGSSSTIPIVGVHNRKIMCECPNRRRVLRNGHA